MKTSVFLSYHNSLSTEHKGQNRRKLVQYTNNQSFEYLPLYVVFLSEQTLIQLLAFWIRYKPSLLLISKIPGFRGKQTKRL